MCSRRRAVACSYLLSTMPRADARVTLEYVLPLTSRYVPPSDTVVLEPLRLTMARPLVNRRRNTPERIWYPDTEEPAGPVLLPARGGGGLRRAADRTLVQR